VPVAGAIAGATAAAAYLDAKFHIRNDVRNIRNNWATERSFKQLGARNRLSLWYWFEAQARRMPANEEAIWSRMGCYTWAETYANACRYGQYFLQNGVTSGSLVTFCLTNQPEFVFGTLGAWSIGSAPALINHHLAGDALVHCLKVAGGKLLIVDEDKDTQERVNAVRDRIEGELGMTIRVLDTHLKGEILRLEPTRPDDELRSGVTGKFPMCLFYTRYTASTHAAQILC
jgi:acyl-CoA synthetase (AMP-forming)/AMP-acid ligase II